MSIGDRTWFLTAYGDLTNPTTNGFAGIFDTDDRFKAKRPTELAVKALDKVNNGWAAVSNNLSTIVTTPSAFQSFIEKYELTPQFPLDIQALGAVHFLKEIGRHILGDDIDIFTDQYNKVNRDYYEKVISPAVNRSIAAAPVAVTHLNERRLSDAVLGIIVFSIKLAEEMAQEFLVRIGYHGDNQLMPSTLNVAFDSLYSTWHARALAFASQLMKPGELMSLIREGEPFLNRVTIYRRATEGQPRLSIGFTRDGDVMNWYAKFRDRSPYLPVRDRLAAGYLNMAYQIDGVNLVPIVDSDDVNELMLDLTLPTQEQPIDVEVAASALKNIVSANRGLVFRTEHVERYLQDEGFNGVTELAGFILDVPKGSARDIFSIVDVALPTGTSTAETLSILEHPEVYSGCVMNLLGTQYKVDGIAAKEYARYFAAQTFGALIPYTADSGHIQITSSDKLQAPTKIAELGEFVGSGTTHFLDKTLVRRFATTYLNVSESVLNDMDISVLGTDLLTYYLQVLRLIGFEDIAAAIVTATGSQRPTRTISSNKMIMTWTHSEAYINRLKPLGIQGNQEVRYKLAMLQVYMSKITNDKVLKAFLHAMSIYIAFSTSDLATGSVEDLWKGNVLASLFSGT